MAFNWFETSQYKKLGKVHNMYDYFCLWGFCKQKYFFAF